MAKNGNPLGFATVGNTTAGSFFAFITGATTVSGIFLAFFGLTSFSYILVGDPNVSMYTVLQGLSMLPNPLEFVRDCNEILVSFSKVVSGLKAFNGTTGSVLLNVVISILTAVLTLVSYVFAFLISVVLLPFYLIYFLIRCFACLLFALGFKWTALNVLSQPWQPVSFIIAILGGA